MSGVVDLHVDVLSRLRALAAPAMLAECAWPALQVDHARCRAGGVRLLGAACYVSDDEPEPAAAVNAMLEIAAALEQASHGGWKRVGSPAEHDALPEDTVGLLPTIENARSLEGDLARLLRWREAGVRIVGLTWNGTHELGCGVGASVDDGLSALGLEVVREAARLGLAIDLSHLAARGVAQVLSHPVPVLATHSNAHALCPHRRNLTDEQLRAIAARDGLVGVNVYPPFLGGAGSLRELVEHVLHLGHVLGLERVALGTDLDGIERLPDGFTGHAALPALATALATRGLAPAEVRGVLGENFLRWWRQWA